MEKREEERRGESVRDIVLLQVEMQILFYVGQIGVKLPGPHLYRPPESRFILMYYIFT